MNTIYVDFNNLRPDGRIKGHRTRAALDERVSVEDHSEDMQCEAVVESLTEDGLPVLRLLEETKTGSGWAQ